jgi:hypothetical protein
MANPVHAPQIGTRKARPLKPVHLSQVNVRFGSKADIKPLIANVC